MTMVLLVGVLAFVVGVTSKFADLLNEHGFEWGAGSGAWSGLIWAALATVLTLLNSWVAAMWLGTILFWFMRCKLDHFNHAVAGVSVVLASVYLALHQEFPLAAVLGILAWLAVSGEAQNWLKRRYPDRVGLMKFLRLRLRLYVGPFVLSFVGGTWLPVVAIVAGMLGTEIVTVWHSRIAANHRDQDLLLGIRYRHQSDTGGFMPAPATTPVPGGGSPEHP